MNTPINQPWPEVHFIHLWIEIWIQNNVFYFWSICGIFCHWYYCKIICRFWSHLFSKQIHQWVFHELDVVIMIIADPFVSIHLSTWLSCFSCYRLCVQMFRRFCCQWLCECIAWRHDPMYLMQCFVLLHVCIYLHMWYIAWRHDPMYLRQCFVLLIYAHTCICDVLFGDMAPCIWASVLFY